MSAASAALPALVLLPGWGFDASVWRPLLPLLRPHFRVAALDPPGYRGVPMPDAGYSLTALARAAAAQAPPAAVWLGWSLGALTALRVAVDFPQRVERLILTAATPRFVRGAGWDEALERRTLDGFAARLGDSRDAAFERFLALQTLGLPAARGRARRLRALSALSASDAARPARGALEGGVALLRASDLRAELGRIAQPTLWLMGAEDRLIPAAAGMRAAQAMARGRCRILPDAGHAPFLDCPGQFVAEACAFVGRATV